MDAVTELLAGIRGEVPPAERWDPAKHNQATHGRFVDRKRPDGAADAT